MNKQEQPNVAGTNLSLFGSDLEKKIREHAGDGEPAWKTAGQKDGLEAWRVKQFKLQPVPANQVGSFYEGDSYIVLQTVKTGNAFKWDIYFWLGSKTSQDESGTAAYKTVELDDHLNGTPTQHREVQGHESEEFLHLFSKKGGLRILKGGFESGFNHVEAEKYEPRLLHLRGTTIKNVVVQEVELSAKSLNSSDVFVLDAGLNIYQFNGKDAKPAEKNRGSVLANAIKDEREGQSAVTVFDEGDSDLSAFWKYFGGEQPIAADHQETAKTAAATAAAENKVLFKLSDASGKLQFTKVAEGKLSRSVLSTKDAFVLDAGFEVFAWVGKETSVSERRNALQSALQYLSENQKPLSVPVTRIFEGGENEVFNAQFSA